MLGGGHLNIGRRQQIAPLRNTSQTEIISVPCSKIDATCQTKQNMLHPVSGSIQEEPLQKGRGFLFTSPGRTDGRAPPTPALRSRQLLLHGIQGSVHPQRRPNLMLHLTPKPPLWVVAAAAQVAQCGRVNDTEGAGRVASEVEFGEAPYVHGIPGAPGPGVSNDHIAPNGGIQQYPLTTRFPCDGFPWQNEFGDLGPSASCSPASNEPKESPKITSSTSGPPPPCPTRSGQTQRLAKGAVYPLKFTKQDPLDRRMVGNPHWSPL